MVRTSMYVSSVWTLIEQYKCFEQPIVAHVMKKAYRPN
jgi:hypothetical protein